MTTETLLRRLDTARVWVIGDLMLDEYVQGDVERISPEAPVPVVRIRDRSERLGGAANVALQCATLGAKVQLAGVVGTDSAGDRLVAAARSGGLDVGAIAALPHRPTTYKVRVLSQGQQMLRLEEEERRQVAEADWQPLLDELDRGEKPTAIILSDYAKGFLTDELLRRVIDAAKKRAIPVFVDPKGKDFGRYRGATLLTPNLAEVERATGVDCSNEDLVHDAGRRLLEETRADALVITLGPRGLVLLRPEQEPLHLSAAAREVYDPTGAGDVVVATLATAVAAGIELRDAAMLANAAAGVAVGKVGTAPVSSAEIARSLGSTPRDAVVSRDRLLDVIEGWRLRGKTVVFTNGCFDLLHVGHLALLRGAAELGDRLVVGLNSDASVARLKGATRPLLPAAERARLLEALEIVDAVVVFDEDTPKRLIEAVRPDVLVKGADYRVEEVEGGELVQSYGGRVALVPLVDDRSTSSIVERIRAGES